MKTIVIANQKGGVAKTTTSGAVASMLARKGFKVLAIDMDPQGNLTDNSKASQTEDGVYAVLKKEKNILSCLQNNGIYDILPASILMASVEQELSGTMGREYRLREAIESDALAEHYDYIVIDTPPALGTLTINALVAADYVLIPTMADINATKGISQLNSTIVNVRKYFNKDLEIAGVLLTRFDPRLNISKKVKEVSVMVADMMDAALFETYIRACVAAPEANFKAIDLFDYGPNSTVAKDYEEFIDEFIGRVA